MDLIRKLWEKNLKYPIGVVLVLHQVIPDNHNDMRTGLIEKDSGLYLPEEPLSEDSLASVQVVKMANQYISADARWGRNSFIAFFDSLKRETPRTIRIAYEIVVPSNVSVIDQLVWKTHYEIAASPCKIVGDHDRIFTTAFNFRGG